MWYRAQLHMHSYWSDGRGFPEQAIAAYREAGYHAVCLTDHNEFCTSTDRWREIEPEEGPWPPNVTQAMFDDYAARFDTDTRELPGGAIVRLKTIDELRELFDKPGDFLVMPGVEITQKLGNAHVHVNAINLASPLPSLEGANLIKVVPNTQSRADLMAANAAEIRRVAGERSHLVMANHPFIFFCDLLPQDLIDCPSIQFFEICNNGSAFAPPPETAAYTPEMFWDAVNAFRCREGRPPIYALASDDAHFYDEARKNVLHGGWVTIRAETLTPEALIHAMHRGDFYATTGVELADVRFDDRALHVRVQPQPGVRYRIHLITTKRGFDDHIQWIDSPEDDGRMPRQLPLYSDDIGRTVDIINGTEASYHLEDDDLYVRARIESDVPSNFQVQYYPATKTAWTQPYQR